MNLSHLMTLSGPRWAADQQLLSAGFQIGLLLELPARLQQEYLRNAITGDPADGAPLAPVDAGHEIWASGVTFQRSREAREAESQTGNIYERVYAAERPELFFKAAGWRVIGPDGAIRVRRDSRWNVPEPELTLVLNRHGEICGFTAGNDVSSRDIEGENPLYLPQAKVYNGSCALGPAIRLVENPDVLNNILIHLTILRGGAAIFQGETSTGLMKREFQDLAEYLFRELSFPQGVFLMTGTGIVPPETFSLQPGDEVRVLVDDLLLQNLTA